ncbi:MAG: diaminopimelate epimerase [Bacteroidia bacterium]
MKFRKFSATGNDFLVIEGASLLSPAQRRALCDRHEGVGADGIVEILPSEGEITFYLHYYNADGEKGSFCGNASRVALYVAQERGWLRPDEKILFAAADGIHEGRWPLWVQVRVRAPLKQVADGHWVDTGSPHLLVASLPLPEKEAAFLRKQYDANVTFYWHSEGKWHYQSYERGVEAYTLSCGSGAVAVAHKLGWKGGHLHTPGGELHIQQKDDLSYFLSGQVRETFRGELAHDFFS